MDRESQTAGEQARLAAHIKMEREAQAARRIFGANSTAQCQIAPQVKSSGNQERTPVHASLARLTELINVLDCRSAVLTDRLVAVLRPVMVGTGESGGDAKQGPSCALDDELFALATRIESVIERIDSTRNRLCI